LVLPPPETRKNGKEKEKNRSVERNRSKTEKKRKKNRPVKEKLKLKQTVCCDSLFSQVTASPLAEKGRREEAFSGMFAAASGPKCRQ